MNCDAVRIQDYAYGFLHEDTELEGHLASCARCRANLEALKQERELIADAAASVLEKPAAPAKPSRTGLLGRLSIAASLAVCAVVFYAIFSSVGDSRTPAQSEEDRIRALVEKLGSEDPQQRDDADRALLDAGEPALAILQEALQSDNPEIRGRATRLIKLIERALLAKYLKLTVAADKDVYKPDELIRLTARLVNTGKRTITVFTKDSFGLSSPGTWMRAEREDLIHYELRVTDPGGKELYPPVQTAFGPVFDPPPQYTTPIEEKDFVTLKAGESLELATRTVAPSRSTEKGKAEFASHAAGRYRTGAIYRFRPDNKPANWTLLFQGTADVLWEDAFRGELTAAAEFEVVDSGRVQRLLELLAQGDLAERDGAEKELIEMGTGILPTLLDRLDRSPDPETEGRLKRIIEKLTKTSLEVVKVLGGPRGAGTECAAWSPDGRWFAAARRDVAGVWVFDTKDWSTVSLPGGPGLTKTNALRFSPDGALLAIAAYRPDDDLLQKTSLYSTDGWKLEATLSPPAQHVGFGWIAFQDKDLLLLGSGANVMVVRRRDDGWKTEELKSLPSGDVTSSPDGRWAAARHVTGAAEVIDIRTWNTIAKPEVLTWHGQGRPLWGASFSPDSKLLALDQESDALRIVETERWTFVRDLGAEEGRRVRHFAFTHDSRHLATACGKTLRLWKRGSWEQAASIDFETGRQGLTLLSPSPVQNLLIVGTEDRLFVVRVIEPGRP